MKLYLLFVSCLSALLFQFSFHEENKPYPLTTPRYFPSMPVDSSNLPSINGVALGRLLFYDPILSKNKDLSCSSCHKQEDAFSDKGIAFSLGNNQAPMKRNTMPLFNLAWYDAFFWDGRASSIEAQIFHPIRNPQEMDMSWPELANRLQEHDVYPNLFNATFGNPEIDSVLVSNAIGQFLRTLISSNSKFDQVLAGETFLSEEEYQGFILMNDMTKGDCLHCHTTDANALGTTGSFSNNGLDKIQHPTDYRDYGLGGETKILTDYGRFKIPSLRNLAFTAPYMHDGRFKTLEEVLDFYSEGVHNAVNIDSKMGASSQGGVHLSAKEKDLIISFLKTLNDSSFIENRAFSNPF